MNYNLSQGDRVRISNGIFAGLDAVVVKVLPARERVRVLMEFLGREIEAEVDHGSLLRQTAHPRYLCAPT
jgi:transcriptional antiterminator RfaH